MPIVVGSTPELVTVNDRADELLPTVTEPKSMVVGSADSSPLTAVAVRLAVATGASQPVPASATVIVRSAPRRRSG